MKCTKHLLLIASLILTSCEVNGRYTNTGCDHHFSIEKGIDATCTEDGITSKVFCDICGYVLVDHEVVKAIGHKKVTLDKKDPTCTEDGHQAGTKCTNCDEIYEGLEVIPALGHDFIEISPKVEPTHDHTGLTALFRCERCGYEEGNRVIPRKHLKGTFVNYYLEEDEFVNNPGIFTCSLCDEEYLDEVTYTDVGIPVLSLNGDNNSATKENKVNVECKYDGDTTFDLDATLKIQGNSSQFYPKKNYNIQLYKKDSDYSDKQKVKLVNDWKKQSKYTLKANYIDFSQARNIVSAKIYGQIASSRDNIFTIMINGGAIDGYPVVIYENGVFQGLYTLNTPKEHWRLKMDGDESTREAVLMCNDWTTQGQMYQCIDDNFAGYELEYSSTEDSEIGNGWVKDSFNEMINFINNSSDSDFKANANNYVNVETAIDEMIFTIVTCAYDNTSKNILWVTYDGVQWTPLPYDLDSTWGLVSNGQGLFSPESNMKKPGYNALWDRLLTCYEEEINDRYAYLRSSALSISNIDKAFKDYFHEIPSNLVYADYNRWYENNGILTYDAYYSQIVNFAYERLNYLDSYFNYVSDENVFVVSFSTNDNVRVQLYAGVDQNLVHNDYNKAFAINQTTGLIDTSGDGVVLFKVVSTNSVVPNILGEYDNLVPIDINTYLIEGVQSNLSVSFE